jgi:hypothetical protein
MDDKEASEGGGCSPRSLSILLLAEFVTAAGSWLQG